MHWSMILCIFLEMKTARHGLGELDQRDGKKSKLKGPGVWLIAQGRQQGGIREQKAA